MKSMTNMLIEYFCCRGRQTAHGLLKIALAMCFLASCSRENTKPKQAADWTVDKLLECEPVQGRSLNPDGIAVDIPRAQASFALRKLKLLYEESTLPNSPQDASPISGFYKITFTEASGNSGELLIEQYHSPSMPDMVALDLKTESDIVSFFVPSTTVTSLFRDLGLSLPGDQNGTR